MHYNDDEEESVYNLVEKPQRHVERPPMYRSKHKPTVPPTGSTFIANNTSKPGVTNMNGDPVDIDKSGSAHKTKRPNATMGRVVKNSVNTMNFTLSRSGEPKLPIPERFQYKTKRKPALPKKDEKPIMGLTTTKNFVVSNAVENILSLTQKRPSKEMNWTQREEFGKVPKYLADIKREIEAEYTYIDQLQARQASNGEGTMKIMSDEEREKLVEALKQRHDEVQKIYDHQSFTLPAARKSSGSSSVPQLERFKIEKKEKLEAELEQLEKYIEKLSKPSVLVM